MRNIYITVAALFLLSVILFIGAFVYLDKEKHATYHYIVNVDGHDVGAIKIEKFVTEDKILYRSSSDIPFYPLSANSKSRIVLDNKYNLSSYSKETLLNGAPETIHLENKNDILSFTATFQSEFAYLKEIPINKKTFVFEEESPVTYMPLIENYNFRKGRFQGFNAIINFSTFKPPMKRLVTLTSIRDEYLKIGSKKIKTEHLLLKIRNYPQGSLWVAKSDKSLIMVEIPDSKLKITRTFSPKTFSAKEYGSEKEGYESRDVIIKTKNVQLAGTLSAPKGDNKYPTVLLIWGDGPQDRQYQGFFYSIADYLSRWGFCVVRFDKRGIGSSGGEFSATTDSDTIEDVKAALEYAATQKEVDPERIAILGHSKGVFYASAAASSNDTVKALVLMSPVTSFGIGADINFDAMKQLAAESRWSEDYLKLVMRSRMETLDKIKNNNKNWTAILGKRCFLKKMREELTENPVEGVKNIKIPVLILQERDSAAGLAESASILDKALEESGNKAHTLTYFGYLGRFFGTLVNDGVHKMHYEADKDVLYTIKSWLEKSLEAPEAKK